MANFPTSLDNSASLPNPNGTDKQNSPDHGALHTNENAAIIALEGKLGTGASTPVANTLLLGTGTGTSAWSQATSAQLAASLSDETGSGAAVFANSPTLITPKVDTIQESTLNNGVTVGGVNLKNGAIPASAIPAAAITPGRLATGGAAAYVTNGESTSSTTYVDLATVTDTVTVIVGSNGLALVNISATMFSAQTYVGFAISGATTVAASDSRCLLMNTVTCSLGGSFLVTGLSSGSTTFKMKYRVASGTGTFTERRIGVVPL